MQSHNTFLENAFWRRERRGFMKRTERRSAEREPAPTVAFRYRMQPIFQKQGQSQCSGRNNWKLVLDCNSFYLLSLATSLP
jgi:hypothetical protein